MRRFFCGHAYSTDLIGDFRRTSEPWWKNSSWLNESAYFRTKKPWIIKHNAVSFQSINKESMARSSNKLNCCFQFFIVSCSSNSISNYYCRLSWSMLQFTFACVADKFLGNEISKLDLILNLKKRNTRTHTLAVFCAICLFQMRLVAISCCLLL